MWCLQSPHHVLSANREAAVGAVGRTTVSGREERASLRGDSAAHERQHSPRLAVSSPRTAFWSNPISSPVPSAVCTNPLWKTADEPLRTSSCRSGWGGGGVKFKRERESGGWCDDADCSALHQPPTPSSPLPLHTPTTPPLSAGQLFDAKRGRVAAGAGVARGSVRMSDMSVVAVVVVFFGGGLDAPPHRAPCATPPTPTRHGPTALPAVLKETQQGLQVEGKEEAERGKYCVRSKCEET